MKLKEISIEDIQNTCWEYSKLNKRKLFELNKLVQNGISLNPIKVKDATKGYWLLDGSHRLNIYKKNGIRKVWAEIT